MSAEQVMRVSPSLIALNQILALSSQELQQEIHKELESNPALELNEAPVCPNCGDVIKGRVCQRCLVDNPNGLNHTQERQTNTGDYSYGEDYYTGEDSYSGGGGANFDEDFDPITIVAAEAPLTERLLVELALVLPEEDMPLGEFLIGSLDERGYLTASTAAIAQTFHTEEAHVESILKELQQIAPAGVAARDLRECLLLQLDHLQETDKEINIPAQLRTLIDQYLTELGEHKYGHIAQQLHISVEQVHQLREFIKQHLNPFPSEGGETYGLVRNNGKAGYVVPDVIISERDGEFKVEIIESKRLYLRINPLYAHLSAASTIETISATERDHVRQYVARAKFFMSNINQRRETMLKITQCLIDIQAEFLRSGVRDLRPLTRSQLANYIGMHESTISRATANKYVMLPTRKVIPFSDFFTASLSTKDVIKEIVEVEGGKRNKPLTDQEIVEHLEDRGIRIARRTVAKYRAQLRILPSTLR
jgi:RNA polymerase sigma-54 factor